MRCTPIATLLLLACAGAKPTTAAAPAAPAPGPADPRCAAVADSVGSSTELSQLTLAAPQRPLRPPPLGGDVPPGGSVVVTVLVRPDGTADLSRLEIRGTRDAGYVARVRSVLEAARFRPVTVGGCAVPGRFTYVTSRVPSGARQDARRPGSTPQPAPPQRNLALGAHTDPRPAIAAS